VAVGVTAADVMAAAAAVVAAEAEYGQRVTLDGELAVAQAGALAAGRVAREVAAVRCGPPPRRPRVP